MKTLLLEDWIMPRFVSLRWPAAILALVALIPACSPKPQYTLTQEQILARAKTLPGEIYLSEGAPGPYREGPGAVGGVNTSGSLHSTSKSGRQSQASWPATPGFYYEADSYLNEAGEAFYLVRKIPSR
jgi:hypothetical protein